MVPRETRVKSPDVQDPTSSRETSGLEEKQNKLFPEGPYIKCILKSVTKIGGHHPFSGIIQKLQF